MKELTIARNLVHENRFEEAFRELEKLRQISEDPEALYLGSLALFGLGHIYQAEEWVRSFGKATGFSTDYQYLEAYIQLHHQRFDQALICWTEVLQLDPSQTLADQLIERIKQDEAAVLEELRIPANFREYIPGRRVLKRRFPFKRLLAPALALLALFLGLFAYFYSDALRRPTIELPAPAHITLIPESQYKTAEERPLVFYQEKAEIAAIFLQIQELAGKYEFNRARMLLGELELSNAGFEVKERARLLRSFLPFSRDLADPASLAQIKANPYALRGAQVRWSGPVVFSSDRDLIFEHEKARIRVFFQEGQKRPAGRQIAVEGLFQKIGSDGTILIEGRKIEDL